MEEQVARVYYSISCQIITVHSRAVDIRIKEQPIIIRIYNHRVQRLIAIASSTAMCAPACKTMSRTTKGPHPCQV